MGVGAGVITGAGVGVGVGGGVTSGRRVGVGVGAGVGVTTSSFSVLELTLVSLARRARTSICVAPSLGRYSTSKV